MSKADSSNFLIKITKTLKIQNARKLNGRLTDVVRIRYKVVVIYSYCYFNINNIYLEL